MVWLGEYFLRCDGVARPCMGPAWCSGRSLDRFVLCCSLLWLLVSGVLICRTKSKQSATLYLFFITNIAAVFTLILLDRYFLFIPPPFAHTAHSPSLCLPSAVTHVLIFQNPRKVTSRRCIPGRVDSAKNNMYTTY